MLTPGWTPIWKEDPFLPPLPSLIFPPAFLFAPPPVLAFIGALLSLASLLLAPDLDRLAHTNENLCKPCSLPPRSDSQRHRMLTSGAKAQGSSGKQRGPADIFLPL